MSSVPQGLPDRVGWEPDQPAPFTPYIPAETQLRELTVLPVIVGTVLGVIFGASSLYLVLKVGLTVSASIPVAVISITLFRILSKMGMRNATILENNVVQTAGSAGESIAFGVGVTMPAILILGFDLEITRVMLVAILGGLIGILMMIPLRRALIVAQHGVLKYPEGTACAEVLKAGASDESRAAASEEAKREQEALGGAGTSGKTIFTGFGIGLVYKTVMVALRGWKDTPSKVFGAPFTAASLSVEISPELLGVGYIIGPRIAAVMCAGGVLAYLVLIPMIKFFGSSLVAPLAPEATMLIRDMGPGDIRNAYVLYIGAGAVAAGGIISVFRSLPIIWHGIKGGMRDISNARGGADTPTVPRTDRDLSINVVLIGIVALLLVIAFANPLYVGGTGIAARVAAAVLIIVFGFLFVTVSSRLTGEIGSSSNPISGMTVATLLLTCLCFVILGWTGNNYFVTALSIGAIVCIASSNGGTTSQDLKTGFLVGATPKAQQISILIGALASALVLGPILLKLNDAYSVYVPVGATGSGITSGSAKAGEIAQRKDFHGRAHVQGMLLNGGTDAKEYNVWFRQGDTGANAEKYLVDDAGKPVYYVDPGINGSIRKLPNGTDVTKFDAPKATLMSYIIKGILGGKLPWGLVLLGVMIAVVLELSGIPSLAFAVGVYLPLSSSTPLLAGGLVRWGVDKWIAKKHAGKQLTEDQLVAEGDKSPGVLLASGYIAGGAIAGILIAFLAGVPSMAGINKTIGDIAAKNPFSEGASSDLLSLIPFAIIIALLYLTGRETILAHREGDV
ncbi:MAG: oligopeptide transporter, OPT family [Acidobacteria bacterium]|nr:oligopeptide transporter, OPT family [Acidobacteriota bacterium]MBV9477470.1 oligopeptide transporter, OPT family [Acidobacteriota bacterium]